MTVFWTVFWCAWIVSLVVGPYLVSSNGRELLRRATKKTHALPASNPGKNLSDVAKHVYEEYMKLPADSRPFLDIVSVLEGLDAATSHDVAGRTYHFNQNGHMRERFGDRWEYRFSWHPNHQSCSHQRCDFNGYYTLHVEIQELLDQIAKKERALNIQINADNASRAHDLVEALRQERKIQQQVTRELS